MVHFNPLHTHCFKLSIIHSNDQTNKSNTNTSPHANNTTRNRQNRLSEGPKYIDAVVIHKNNDQVNIPSVDNKSLISPHAARKQSLVILIETPQPGS